MRLYRLWDKQTLTYLATGNGCRTKEDVKCDLLSYYSADHDDKDIESLSKMTPDDVAEIGDFEIRSYEIPEEIVCGGCGEESILVEADDGYGAATYRCHRGDCGAAETLDHEAIEDDEELSKPVE